MATDNFIGRPYLRPALGELDVTSFTIGTSDTAANFFAVRWQSDTGSGATGVIRDDLIKFLDDVRQFVLRGGKLQDGTGVPPTSL